MKIAIDRYVMLESDLVSSLELPLYSKGLLTVILVELLLDLFSPKPPLPASTVLRAEDDTATGPTEASLSSKLHFTRDEHGQEVCLLRESNKEAGVMMGLERSHEHQWVQALGSLTKIRSGTIGGPQVLCADHPKINEGLKIVDFGLGIVSRSIFPLCGRRYFDQPRNEYECLIRVRRQDFHCEGHIQLQTRRIDLYHPTPRCTKYP